MTGAGKNSIALEIVKNLLAGGAKVVLTTSSYSYDKTNLYRDLYRDHAAIGAELILLPCSQGSLGDIQKLAAYMFEAGLVPDYLIPFAALAEENSLPDLGGESLGILRITLLGVERLIGEIAGHYHKNLIQHKKFTTLLPLSPNLGIFGRDGLYAESKIALENLFRKYYSEYDDWGKYCDIIGARIGWVRGTGLMEANDLVAPALESQTGVKTFHRREMGVLLSALLTPDLRGDENIGPLEANLSGGLDRANDLRATLAGIREELDNRARHKRELSVLQKKAGLFKNDISGGGEFANEDARFLKTPGSPSRVYPDLPGEAELENFTNIEGKDLKELICVVGFGEIGPGGSEATRWEIEQGGELSLEGIRELAWTMGFIRYENSPTGRIWIDRESETEALPGELRARYEKRILEGCGVRVINPELQGFDPLNAPVYSEVLLEEDFFIPAASEAEAEEFNRALPESSEVYFDQAKERWFVKRPAGSTIRVLKSVRLDRYVAGQIPDGFDPTLYGIPGDLVKQVDRIVIFNIIATSLAFLNAGMEPFELYEYLHPSEVGSVQGSGMGGISKLGNLYVDFMMDENRQNDTIQEALINVTSAYILTTLVGGAGPIQTPVSACATGAVSLDMAVNLIKQDKARFLVAGAFDDVSSESMLGFGDMEATANPDDMLKRGIPFQAMCRPNDSRRGGFVESQGGGTVLLARGDLAFEMGLPVYGLLAFTATHSDGINTSIPAPGQGLLSVAAGERQVLKEGSPQDPGDSPLGRTLREFHLTADDIHLVYKHDTSTKANDFNENRLHHLIQKNLGRKPGNPLAVVSQKSLTGHSKGGAAIWQMNGLLQGLGDGVITGNQNLQNVDPDMNEFDTLVFPEQTIQIGPFKLRAGLLTSLGFGHVGAIALCLNGAFFYGALSPEKRESYAARRKKRELYTRSRKNEIMLGDEGALYRRKKTGPFKDKETETRVFLDRKARLSRGADSYVLR